jgi:hypothetical protein
MWTIYEFIEPGGNSVLRDWPLQKRERIRLNQKLDLLMQYGLGAPGLVGGPNIGKQRHIYKLKVRGDVQLRPMFCRGPFDTNTELTFLAIATERDRVLVPANAPRLAEFRRQQLISGRGMRRRRDEIDP